MTGRKGGRGLGMVFCLCSPSSPWVPGYGIPAQHAQAIHTIGGRWRLSNHCHYRAPHYYQNFLGFVPRLPPPPEWQLRTWTWLSGHDDNGLTIGWDDLMVFSNLNDSKLSQELLYHWSAWRKAEPTTTPAHSYKTCSLCLAPTPPFLPISFPAVTPLCGQGVGFSLYLGSVHCQPSARAVTPHSASLSTQQGWSCDANPWFVRVVPLKLAGLSSQGRISSEEHNGL